MRRAKSRPRIPLTFSGERRLARHSDLISSIHAKNKADEGQELVLESGLIDEYQKASLYGNKHFDASRWLLANLCRKGLPKRARLLDVGSLRPVYAKYSWIDATHIDLHPRHPGILQQDLFTFEPDSGFDVVCMSLVINFVGCPRRRYQMLVKARDLLRPAGYLMIVLPRAVLDNSRRMTADHFVSICSRVGLTVLRSHTSAKLSFFLFARSEPLLGPLPDAPKLKVSGANNFRITPPATDM